MTALARASSNCKLHTRPLIREDVKDYDCRDSVKKILVVDLKGLNAKTN
jgi:hypothetical protein